MGPILIQLTTGKQHQPLDLGPDKNVRLIGNSWSYIHGNMVPSRSDNQYMGHKILFIM